MRQFLMSGSVRGAACKGRPYRDFKVNLIFESLYGSVLGDEGFLAELGGECGGPL